MKPVYVLIDKATGNFWTPKRTSRFSKVRAIYAFKSEAKCLSVIKQFDDKADKNEIEIKKYECNETLPNNS